jgi:hypothetical protein
VKSGRTLFIWAFLTIGLVIGGRVAPTAYGQQGPNAAEQDSLAGESTALAPAPSNYGFNERLEGDSTGTKLADWDVRQGALAKEAKSATADDSYGALVDSAEIASSPFTIKGTSQALSFDYRFWDDSRLSDSDLHLEEPNPDSRPTEKLEEHEYRLPEAEAKAPEDSKEPKLSSQAYRLQVYVLSGQDYAAMRCTNLASCHS